MPQKLTDKKTYDREYYRKHREEVLEKKKIYERQRYEQEKQRAAAEQAALERMMKREIPRKITMEQFTKNAEELYRRTMNAQRLSELRKKSWFAGWLMDRGIDQDDARRGINADGATWEALLRGERTVPGIALIVGNLLGMTPEEVRQIGITPDAGNRRGECFTGCPWHIDAAWWERVKDFPGQKEADLLWGRNKMRYSMERHPGTEHEKPRIPWSTFKPEEQEPINEGGRIYRDGTTIVKNRCLICDQLFIGSPSKKYCSVGCRSAAQIRMRTGEIVGPQTEEEREARKRANKNRWRRKDRAMGKKV